jgi:acyl-coenzyme A thioesterase PaaI-like protein
MNITGPTVRALWRRLAPVPGGALLFSLVLRRWVPYSGTIRPRVTLLEAGHARVQLRERRRLRNHLRSVHALALANLGELASGLAMTLALPPSTRGIPTRMDVEFLKKARGVITADGRAAPPEAVPEPRDAMATAELADETGDLVARMTVTWRLAPDPPGPARSGREIA